MFKLLLVAFIFLFSLSPKYLLAQNISEKQVDSVFVSMVKSAEKIDYDALAKGVDDRFSAGFISGASYFSRLGDLVSNAKSLSNNVVRQMIKIQEKKIVAISDDVVLVSATGDSQIEINTGILIPLKFFWTFVYKRFDGEWKIIQSHQSSNR